VVSRNSTPTWTRRLWLLGFAGFLLIGIGWSTALPANGTNDENQHIIRAYGVASGQVWSAPADAVRGGGAWFRIPRSLLPTNVDCPQVQAKAASCQLPAPADPTRIWLGSAAGRYNPLYYVPVGLPMVLSPNMGGIIAGRIISAALVAALLASALLIAVRRRSPMLVAAVIVVSTPNLLNLGGSINPSGLELAAGILTWTALLALVRPLRPVVPTGPTVAADVDAVAARADAALDLDERWTTVLLRFAALGAAVLITIRTLGPLLLLLTLLFGATLARPGRLRELWARAETRRLAVGLCAVGAYAVCWTLFSGVLDNPPQPTAVDPLTLNEKLGWIAQDRFTQWVAQVVGRFSYGEVSAPYGLMVGWYALGLLILVPTLLLANRRQVAVLVGIVVTSLAVLVGFELLYYDHLGWAQQSRYVLPFGVGAILGAGALRRWERVLPPAAVRRFVLTVAVGTAVMHVWALAVVMTRFQIEQRFQALLPFDGFWLPATGPQFPLLSTALGGLVLLILVARTVRIDRGTEPAAGGGAGAAADPTTVSGSEPGGVAPAGEETSWPVPDEARS
jgi:hypothetical protein